MLEELREVRRVAAALTSIGANYALGGSMASSLLGSPRFTQDADLTVEPFPGREQQLAAHFGPEYYLSVPAMVEANRTHRAFNIINIATGFKIDLFVRRDRPFEHSALMRGILTSLPDAPGEPIRVLTAEDILLFKLEWYRLGDEVSDRQWNDILGILKVRGQQLDLEYVRRFAGELAVTDLLERAFDDAAPGG